MFRKKNFLFILFVLLLFIPVSACGKKGGSSEDNVQLTLSNWDTEQAPGIRKMLDAFEKENPNIKVTMETTPWDQYWTKLEAAGTGGNMADVVIMHSNESYKYMSAGMLMPLDDVIKDKNIDMNDFYDGVETLYTYENELYAIPKDISAIGLWYNKKIFDKAGVDYPDNTWDWNKFQESAIKLTNRNENIYGFAADNAPETGYWPLILQNDGEIYNKDNTKSTFNSSENIETLKFYNDLINEYKVSPTIKELQDTDKITRFQSGQIAMIFEGNWQTPGFEKNEYTKENIDVSVLPKGKSNATITNGLGWCGSANTKHPDEVKKLLTFLASEKANKIQADTGTSIPALKGFEDEWASSVNDFNLKAFGEMLPYGHIRPFNKNGLKSELLEKEVMNKVFSEEIPVKEGVEQVQNGIDKILSE